MNNKHRFASKFRINKRKEVKHQKKKNEPKSPCTSVRTAWFFMLFCCSAQTRAFQHQYDDDDDVYDDGGREQQQQTLWNHVRMQNMRFFHFCLSSIKSNICINDRLVRSIFECRTLIILQHFEEKFQESNSKSRTTERKQKKVNSKFIGFHNSE